MKNQTEGILMKSRSANACLREGYRLYTSSLKKILKASWHVAILYSIVCSILYSAGVNFMAHLPMQMLLDTKTTQTFAQDYILYICLILLLIIVGGLFELASYSCGISILKQHLSTGSIPVSRSYLYFDRSTFWRTLKAALSALVLLTVLSSIILLAIYLPLHSMTGGIPAHKITAITFITLAFVLIGLFMLPLSYMCMKYIFNSDTLFWKQLAHDYSIGMKHFGFVFIIVFVSLLVVGITEYILINPAFILSVASYQAHLGVINGDALGMPQYIPFISAVVFFLAGFVQMYIRMSTIFTTYYMYGSIETQECERKRFKESSSPTELNKTI